jgi:hypothetical protein
MKKKIFTILTASIVMICILLPTTNALASDYELLEPLPALDGSGKSEPTMNTQEYLGYMFNLFVAVCAVAAVFMIVWGGFEYMTSDAVNKKDDGLKKVKGAVYGLLLALSSFLIVQTIDPRFVNIPETLVPPLKISNTTDAFSTWTTYSEMLKSQIDKIDSQKFAETKQVTAEAKATLAANEERISELDSELAALDKEYWKAYEEGADEETLRDIEEKIYSIDDEITRLQSNSSFTTANALSENSVAIARAAASGASGESAYPPSRILTEYSDKLTPEEKIELERKTAYLQAVYDINMAAANANKELDDTFSLRLSKRTEIRTGAEAQMDTIRNSYLNNPYITPELNKKLIEEQELAMKKIK